MLFRGLNYKLSSKRPPRVYPDISEPGESRVNYINFPEEVLDQEYKYNKIVINM